MTEEANNGTLHSRLREQYSTKEMFCKFCKRDIDIEDEHEHCEQCDNIFHIECCSDIQEIGDNIFCSEKCKGEYERENGWIYTTDNDQDIEVEFSTDIDNKPCYFIQSDVAKIRESKLESFIEFLQGILDKQKEYQN